VHPSPVLPRPKAAKIGVYRHFVQKKDEQKPRLSVKARQKPRYSINSRTTLLLALHRLADTVCIDGQPGAS